MGIILAVVACITVGCLVYLYFTRKEIKATRSKSEAESLQEKFKLEFENIANKLLEEKSKKFLEINKKNIDEILIPLKDRIEDFKKKVEALYTEEGKDRASLKTEIKQIHELNQQLSSDAKQLTDALKGNKKMLGDWGETQLEIILESAGFIENVHYRKQKGKDQRPDYIINLPDQKHLVIDSKASLVNYVHYFNAENDEKREEHLKNLTGNIRTHIKDLSEVDYKEIHQINSPDYVLMFIPIEPVFFLTVKNEPRLFDYAWRQNIILVTTSTLIATLRIVSYMWKQKDVEKNTLEIANQSGALYDKFVGFMEDLTSIGKSIDATKKSYEDAMNKLFYSPKKGETLVGRVENIRKLGAKATKTLSQEVLDKAEQSQDIQK